MIDEITAMLGHMPEAEREQRSRLLQCRNVATHRAERTGGPNARGLLWMCNNAATAFVFTTANVATLTKAATLCRLMIELSALANELEADDGLARA